MGRPTASGSTLECPLCTELVAEIFRSRHGRLCWTCYEVVDVMYAIFSDSYKWWEAWSADT